MEHKRKNRHKQSVMEHIVTHIWSIIIILVILVSLFLIGIFGGSLFQPKAAAANKPEFVAHFGYSGPFEEFGNSNLSVNSTKFMPLITNNNGGKLTMTGWIYADQLEPVETAFSYGDFKESAAPYNAVFANINESPYCNNGLLEGIYSSYVCIYSRPIPTYSWVFVAVEYNGSKEIGYAVLNGNILSANATVAPFAIPAQSSFLIGTPWNGLISDVQLYNTSLSENSLMELYLEGLAGNPLNAKNLVGWWPLDGNGNDYSGNGNNAVPLSSAASSIWQSNYTSP
jgi:hypothetical protein